MLSRSSSNLGWALVFATVSTGCVASEADHAPTLECGDNGCAAPSGATGSGSVGGSSSSGTSTAAAGQATLEGRVVELTENNFVASKAPLATGSFTIVVPSASGAELSSSEGSEFTLEGVKSAASLYLSVKSVPATTYLQGLVALNTIEQTNVTLPVLRSDTLALVASSITNAFVTLDNSLGQVVLRFADSSGAAVRGLKVSLSGAGAIAYDEGGAYTTDNLVGTGPRGLAFLLNVTAGKTPAQYPVTVSGTATGTFTVWIQAGAVTVAEPVATTN